MPGRCIDDYEDVRLLFHTCLDSRINPYILTNQQAKTMPLEFKYSGCCARGKNPAFIKYAVIWQCLFTVARNNLTLKQYCCTVVSLRFTATYWSTHLLAARD